MLDIMEQFGARGETKEGERKQERNEGVVPFHASWTVPPDSGIVLVEKTLTLLRRLRRVV